MTELSFTKQHSFVKKITHIDAPDNSRVMAQLFVPSWERASAVVSHLETLSENKISSIWDELDSHFSSRHDAYTQILDRHYSIVEGELRAQFDQNIESRSLVFRRVVGAYFTKEFAVESSAFCNPSIVLHPDQTGVNAEEKRVIVSVRAVGEGHISSLVFRSGVLGKDCTISFDPITPYVHSPKVNPNPIYEKKYFQSKLKHVLKHYEGTVLQTQVTEAILASLPERFSVEQLRKKMTDMDTEKWDSFIKNTVFNAVNWIVDSNYDIHFDPASDIFERVIYPVSSNERNGIEDVRFVPFLEEGQVSYVGTYTAYNGVAILPQIISTSNFCDFRIRTLDGQAAKNKGMALFPKKINGKYTMISRQDGVGMHIMYSDSLYSWESAAPLREPEEAWEYIQIGNCGSPIETEAGWLLLTHGVGPMRRYCIGADLLDLNDPSRIIGRLKEPLIIPGNLERDGYVPNVVYSCGGLIHNDHLILPYGYSDYGSNYAVIELNPLLQAMKL